MHKFHLIIVFLFIFICGAAVSYGVEYNIPFSSLTGSSGEQKTSASYTAKECTGQPYAESTPASSSYRSISGDLGMAAAAIKISDSQGPTIEAIYVNDVKTFDNDIIGVAPKITSTLKDSSGINATSIDILIDSTSVGNANITKTATADGYYIEYSKTTTFSAGAHKIKVRAADPFGNYNEKEVNVQVKEGSSALVGRALNYPNPFSPGKGQTTKIAYTLTVDTDITIYMFDKVASQVWKRTFIAGTSGGKAGYNEITLDGKSDFGGILANGTYVYKIISGGKVIGTSKLTVFD